MNWVSFPGLGIGKFFISEYAFEILGIKIYYYAIIFSLAIVSGTFYAYYMSEKIGILRSKCIDIILFSLILGIVGARLYYVIFNINEFLKDKSSIWNVVFDMLNLRSGGIAIYGGLIFAFITGAVICKINKIKILPMLDLAGMSLLLSQAIGRWGNFFNIEAYGIKTNLPWGMMSNKIMPNLQPVHPTFFYESVWCFIGFILINCLFKNRKFDGELFLIYLTWYSFARFFIEDLRTDSLMFFQTNIKISQALSLILFIVAGSLLIYFYCKFKKNKIKLYANSTAWHKILNKK